ncbi:MAG: glycosyltransferase family 9 protein [Saprospiraceae bacterium]|nr:glycosyltransferase family 9 protein [Saprospiraceae bacterium]MBP7679567.1 glycosyltransferase family 9 protein [Saprospiraceae bacterium]
MKNILIIQTAFIGDVILATPIVEQLRRHFPMLQIDFLLRKGNESLLANYPYIRKVIIWDKQRNKYRNLWATLRTIRRERYDAVINLQRFFSTGLLTALSGAKQTIGFNKNPLAVLFDKRIAHIVDGRHEVQRNLALIHHLTMDATVDKPQLYPSDSDRKAVQYLGKYVCIAPTSVWQTKMLPLEKWLLLINGLSNVTVFLLGAKSDKAFCENLQKKVTNANITIINKTGELTFLQSAALMQGAMMNYVNDSAPLHFASAMNAPVTAFFCSTVPKFGFTPLSDVSIVRESCHNLACRPCGLAGKAACPHGHFLCGDINQF